MICTKCEEDKPVEDFYKLKNKCKSCYSKMKQKYRRSKSGLIVTIYNNQKNSTKKRKHQPPTYSRQELEQWCFSQKLFHRLYDNWKRLDFQTGYIPSVDRKKDNISYTIANIQLMTWKENNKKTGNKAAAKANRKKVRNSTNGEIFSSITKAASSANIETTHIASAIKRRGKSGGFRWEYIDD